MSERAWWKDAVVYQIYPRSFNDSDGDGIGDIPGIIEKVDYLDDLGIDAVWLNPVYESPMADNGYDVADYRSIHPDYGSMADWERLRDALHARDIRLVMDIVVNHTSDEHEWFERSRAGEEPYAEYYYWRESGDGPPNNWESFFGGSAWSYDDTRDAWYLHLFDEKQPDLNWQHPQVRAEIYDIMTWWLEHGVDGFRMDVINLLSKPEGLPDGAPNDFHVGIEHFLDGPHLDRYLAELHEEALAGTEAMTVGEMPGIHAGRALDFVGADGPLSMVITFEHLQVDWGPGGKWDPVEYEPRRLIEALSNWQAAMAEEGWNCLYLENHDQPRVVSRFGDDERYHHESATALATVLLTLRGTPFIYQGQELGMTNGAFHTRQDIDDIEARNFVDEALASDEYEDYDDVRPIVEERSRDNARFPMQWSADHAAGFTEGDPWITGTGNRPDRTVRAARADPDSVWHYYQELIDLRADTDALRLGSFERLDTDAEDIFTYLRRDKNDCLLVIANLGYDPCDVDIDVGNAEPMQYNYSNPPAGDPGSLSIRPFESVIYSMQ